MNKENVKKAQQPNKTQPQPPQLSEEEKKRKAAEKAARKAEFEAKNKEKLEAAAKAKQAKAKVAAGKAPGEVTNDVPTKSNAELKAERRAKQEAQRAAKQNAQAGGDGKTNVKPSAVAAPSSQPVKVVETVKEKVKEGSSTTTKPMASHSPSPLIHRGGGDSLNGSQRTFAHLPQKALNMYDIPIDGVPVPVVAVGYRINTDKIRGPTAKCVSMMTAFKQVIESYRPTESIDMKRDLQKILFTDCFNFLSQCRPLSISMDNAIKHLRFEFTKITDLHDPEAIKAKLVDKITDFIEDEVMCSWRQIVKLSSDNQCIKNGDVILTVGYAMLIKHVFVNAVKKGVKFSVIVVDTRPRFEGRQMLDDLIKYKIPTTYVLINSVSYVMKEVSKVIIASQSMLANGYVMSYMGSSQVAMVAKAYNVPVIVCCETYKFSDRVHTDCFVHNELGDESSFFSTLTPENASKCLSEYRSLPSWNVLDLLYDLTPHEFISVVITEKGLLPCTSVPAILRVRETK